MIQTRPLQHIRVFELGHSLAAPMAGLILAQLGAEVIKVEMPPKGDHARLWGPPFTRGAATAFQVMNRGKQSIACNLSDSQQKQALLDQLKNDADVVLHNLKPGTMEKLGLDGQTLLRLNPRLIVCNIAAFGRQGPLRMQPGYDPLMQAFSGLMGLCGEPGSAPARVPVSLIDLGTGLWAVIGILSALRQRDALGQGCVVDTSLLEVALNWMTLPISGYLANGEVPKRQGSGLAEIVPYQVFAAGDGKDMMVAAGNDGLFRKLCNVMELPELASDPRFIGNPDRVVHKQELIPLLQSRFNEQPRSYWLDCLQEAGVPAGPLQTVDEVVAHPQVQALNILQQARGDDFRTVGLPLEFDGMRPQLEAMAPKLGEHNAVHGFEVAHLKASSVSVEQ